MNRIVTGVHLQIAIFDQGKTIGGHQGDGCIIYTTAEIVIGASEEFNFTAEFKYLNHICRRGARPCAPTDAQKSIYSIFKLKGKRA